MPRSEVNVGWIEVGRKLHVQTKVDPSRQVGKDALV